MLFFIKNTNTIQGNVNFEVRFEDDKLIKIIEIYVAKRNLNIRSSYLNNTNQIDHVNNIE